MINEIKVSGYKSIQESAIKLNNLNILIGTNGSGKTNFLSIFKFLNHIINENLQKTVMLSGGADNFLYYGREITNKITIEIEFGTSKYHIELSPTRDILIIDKEVLTSTSPNNSPSDIPFTKKELESNFRRETLLRPSKIADQMLDAMKDWKIYHFHDTSANSPIRSTTKINDLNYFNDDGSNLASYLYFLKQHHPQNYLSIEKSIQHVAPYFDKFKLEPNLSNKKMIYLKWLSKGFDQQMSIDDFSDGTLRFICYATLLQQPQEFIPQTLIIDEPELGLHPKALESLASMIKTLSKQKQVLVSTQSVEFINYFDIGDLIVVERDNTDSKFKRLEYEKFEKLLEEYSVGDLWIKNLLEGR